MVTRFPRDGVVESHLSTEYVRVTILHGCKNRIFLNTVFLLYASLVDSTQYNVIYTIRFLHFSDQTVQQWTEDLKIEKSGEIFEQINYE